MSGTSWSARDSEELYSLPDWGLGLFRVNERGDVTVHPDPERPEREIVLPQLLDDLGRRGIRAPLLLRFNDLLRCRVHHLFDCFAQGIEREGYTGRYRGVYPIKVNQQRHVVEALLDAGRERGMGLEVGSKPELLAALAMMPDTDGLLICNGAKDRDFLRTALAARRLGIDCVIVVERPDELPMLLEEAAQEGVEPVVGFRAKLASKGSGRWESSGGDRSKFGLDATALVAAVDLLSAHGKLDALQLLHFHMGSQVTGIASLQSALREGARLYVELVRMGAPLRLFDVGGGLGVDYDGTRSPVDVSVDYTDQEYANEVVSVTRRACEDGGVPHPDLVTESGRALVAHHSVLVVEVSGSSERSPTAVAGDIPDDAPACLKDLEEVARGESDDTLETFHRVLHLRDELRGQFLHGVVDLRQRALGEELAHRTLRRMVQEAREDSVDLHERQIELAPTLYCNFSVFQSLPDHWAIAQRFPVLPLRGLQQRPDREVTLADLTCDSDGKVDSFIGGDPRRTLPVPADLDTGAHLGFFLVGAYQEILGDLHNLFGDTAAVHVDLDDEGYRLSHYVEADRISEILQWVQYPRPVLLDTLRRRTEDAMRRGTLSPERAARFLERYAHSLESSTYPQASPLGRAATGDGS